MLKDKQASDDLVKSLSAELDMPEAEVITLLEKADNEEYSEEEKKEMKKEDKKEGKEEKKDDDKEGKEEKEKDMDYKKSEKADLLKSIAGDMKKLKALQGDDIGKSEENDIEKSISDMKNDFQKSLEDRDEKLEKSFGDFQKSLDTIMGDIDKIGKNSQGVKGHTFGSFIEKAGDLTPLEKDGKKFISGDDRHEISEALLKEVEKADNDDLRKSTSDDLVQYQGSGELNARALRNLNSSGIYLKSQIKEDK